MFYNSHTRRVRQIRLTPFHFLIFGKNIDHLMQGCMFPVINCFSWRRICKFFQKLLYIRNCLCAWICCWQKMHFGWLWKNSIMYANWSTLVFGCKPYMWNSHSWKVPILNPGNPWNFHELRFPGFFWTIIVHPDIPIGVLFNFFSPNHVVCW